MNFNQMMNWILGRSQPANLAPVPEKTVAQAERRISHRLSNSEGIVQIAGVGEFPVKDLSQGGLSMDTHDLKDSSGFQVGSREILHSSRISQDVLKAWLAVLPRPEADLD